MREGKKTMIMIVDDNAKMRETIQSMRGGRLGEFYECCDGLEAVEAYARLQPDWVLLDIKMDRMDGLTAAEAIHRSYPNSNIIIVTQYDDPDLREQAKRAGARGYVLKENLVVLDQMMSSFEGGEEPRGTTES